MFSLAISALGSRSCQTSRIYTNTDTEKAPDQRSLRRPQLICVTMEGATEDNRRQNADGGFETVRSWPSFYVAAQYKGAKWVARVAVSPPR